MNGFSGPKKSRDFWETGPWVGIEPTTFRLVHSCSTNRTSYKASQE